MSDLPPHPGFSEEEIIQAELVASPAYRIPVLGPPPLPRRPPIWPVFMVLVLSFVIQLGAVVTAGLTGMLLQLAARRSPGDFQAAFQEALEAPEYMLITAALTMLGFGVLAAGATWIGGETLRDRLRLTRPLASPGLLLFALAAIVSLQAAFIAATQLEIFPESEVLHEVFVKITLLGPVGKWLAILVIGVAPGICEEALFRGYIQTGLTRRWGPWRGALLTAVFFGVMHLNLIQGAFALLLGLYLGLLTERTGSVVPAMVLHGTNNVLATVMALGDWEPSFTQPQLVLGVAFALMVLTEYIVAAPILRSGLHKSP